MFHSIIKKSAFTLAEVLITLMVIGVLAMITIPGLIGAYEKAVLKSQFKSAQSILYSAYRMMLIQDEADLGTIFQDGQNGRPLKKALMKQLKVTSDYGNNGLFNETNHLYYNYNFTTNQNNSVITEHGQFLINNGMAFFFYGFGLPTHDNGTSNGNYFRISVDVNGPSKGPNAFGHDFFTFRITDDLQLIPDPGSSSIFCDKTSTYVYNGTGCAKYAIEDKCPYDSTKGYWDCLPKK